MQVERELTDERGLWRRPWYRSLVYAPGFYEGYAAKTLPGVREAMEAGEWYIAKNCRRNDSSTRWPEPPR